METHLTIDYATPEHNEDWVSVNDHLDYGPGFVRSGVADTIEARFGVFPRFGMAGGDFSMLMTVDTAALPD